MNNKLNYPTWLVPLEIAQELKGIGFDEKCYFVSTLSEKIGFTSKENYSYYHFIENVDKCNYNKNDGIFSIPTWTDVFAWFRKKNLVGLVSYRYRDKNNKGFSFEILDEDTDVFLYKTYEQAQEALVYKLIEIYKSEQNENLHLR